MSGGSSVADLVREFWLVWGEEGVETLLARHEDFFVEDAVWSPPVAQLAGRDYVGRAGFSDYVNDFNDTFNAFGGELRAGAEEEVAADLWRFEVRVSAELRDGGRLDANLIALVRMRDGRMSYGWGSYDPAAAERRIAELRAESDDADA